MKRTSTVLLALVLSACGREQPTAARFAHIGDPDPIEPGGLPATSDLAAALRVIRDVEGVTALVLTGDLRVRADTAGPAAPTTPTPPAAAPPPAVPDTAAEAADTLGGAAEPPAAADTVQEEGAAGGTPPAAQTSVQAAALDSAANVLMAALQAGNVARVYHVPARAQGVDSASAAALAARLRAQLPGRGVEFRDLTACYAVVDDDACIADPPASGIRLIGFPSGVMRGGTDTAATARQLRDIARLDAMVGRAAIADRAVVVVTAEPPIDRPIRTPADTGAAALTWPVADTVLSAWSRVVRRPAVLAVVGSAAAAGQRALFTSPYGWLRSPHAVAASRRLVLDPPLGAAGEEGRLLQARGFAILTPAATAVTREMFWLEGDGSFERAATATALEPATDGPAAGPADGEAGWTERLFGFLVPGDLWSEAAGPTRLAIAAITAIAVLLAFLTVVEVWKLKPQTADGVVGENAATPFASRFGQTVIAGVGGILAVSILEDILGAEEINGKALYIFDFVVVFLILLLLSALFRGVTEMLRSGMAQPAPVDPRAASSRVVRSYRWFRFGLSRMRAPILVFLDTAFKIVQGDNQLESVVWHRNIVAAQTNTIAVIQRFRDKLQASVERGIEREFIANPLFDGFMFSPQGVRVNVSVVAEPGDELYYVAWAAGASQVVMKRESIAWLAATEGRAFWWKKEYDEFRAATHRRLRSPLLEGGGKAARPSTRVGSLAIDGNAIALQTGETIDVVVIDAAGHHDAKDTGAKTTAATTIEAFLAAVRVQLDPFPVTFTDDGYIEIEGTDSREVGSATLRVIDASGQARVEWPFTVRSEPAPAVVMEAPAEESSADNAAAGGHEPRLLRDWFQGRSGDYEAFIVLPLPWTRRNWKPGFRQGAIHISLKSAAYLDALFALPERGYLHKGKLLQQPIYRSTRSLLDRDATEPPQVRNADLRTALDIAIDTLAQAIQAISDDLFSEIVKQREGIAAAQHVSTTTTNRSDQTQTAGE